MGALGAGPQPFAVDVEEQAGLTLLIPRGELEMASVADFMERRAACTDGKPVAVDLSGLTFIDSTGIRTLLELRRDGVLFRAGGKSVMKTLGLVGVTSHLGL